MRRGWLVAACLLIAVGAWHSWSQRPVHRADGVIAPNDPVQTEFIAPPAPVTIGDTSLEPLAAFTLTARVLSREDYRFDAGSVISPMDLAVGWGRMSNSAILRDIDLEQQDRYYFWHATTLPIPRREIETHSANLHLVPADAGVTRRLKSIRAGDVVTLEGWLVEAERPSGWRWRSSLTRDDTGPGSCELVYVTELSIGPR